MAPATIISKLTTISRTPNPDVFLSQNSTIYILYNLFTSQFVFRKQIHSFPCLPLAMRTEGRSDHTAPRLWSDYQSNMHVKTKQKVKSNHQARFPQILSTNL